MAGATARQKQGNTGGLGSSWAGRRLPDPLDTTRPKALELQPTLRSGAGENKQALISHMWCPLSSPSLLHIAHHREILTGRRQWGT